MFTWLRSRLNRLPDASGNAKTGAAGLPADLQKLLAQGRAHAAQGRRAAAVQAFEDAAQRHAGHAEPLMELAQLAWLQGHKDQALQHLLAAQQRDEAHAELQFSLGNLLRERGQNDEAERHYWRAITLQPEHAGALGNLGALLKDQGEFDEARDMLEQALAIQPDSAISAFNLAMLHASRQHWEDTSRLMLRSLAADPRQPDAQYWLGNARMGLGDAAGAREAYQAAIRLDPKLHQARWGHAMAQLPAVAADAQEQAGAVPAFDHELGKLKTWFAGHRAPDAYLAVGAQQPYYLAYIAQDHKPVLAKYGKLCTSLMSAWPGQPPAATRAAAAAGAKLKVGIVSAHVHSHSVWNALVRGWVEHLDPSRFTLQLFHTGSVKDEQTQWAAGRVQRLHQGLGDWTAWAKAIAYSRLDVLLYPEIGMDATTVRLAALRLAPLQLASWGHPISSGLPSMDGFVSADAFEPPGSAAHYTESLISLPRLGCCYRPMGIKPAPVDLSAWGVAAHERVLLCAGAPFKYAPTDDALWLDIARRCAPCKLVFFHGQAPQLSALLEQRLRRAFDVAGLAFDAHVRFVPWQGSAGFFGLLQRADVLLDSPGFSGFNTAMQATECATPMVAHEGAFMRGRFASGILRQLGLPQWVADSATAYVDRVEQLCRDDDLRQNLRQHTAAQRGRLFDDRGTVTALGEQLLALAAR